MNSLQFTEIIKEICDVLKLNSLKYPNCIAVYLFGSFFRGKNPNDIDVLIVYDNSECDINYQIDGVVLLIEDISKYPVDVTALTENELKETSFLERLSDNYLRVF